MKINKMVKEKINQITNKNNKKESKKALSTPN